MVVFLFWYIFLEKILFFWFGFLVFIFIGRGRVYIFFFIFIEFCIVEIVLLKWFMILLRKYYWFLLYDIWLNYYIVWIFVFGGVIWRVCLRKRFLLRERVFVFFGVVGL